MWFVGDIITLFLSNLLLSFYYTYNSQYWKSWRSISNIIWRSVLTQLATHLDTYSNRHVCFVGFNRFAIWGGSTGHSQWCSTNRDLLWRQMEDTNLIFNPEHCIPEIPAGPWQLCSETFIPPHLHNLVFRVQPGEEHRYGCEKTKWGYCQIADGYAIYCKHR